MRYVVAGQHDSKGVIGDDSSNLNVYYELGWEVTFTNILSKTLLNEGKLSSDDIIVTKNDRSFFYSKLFKNVIDWHEFKTIKTTSDDEIYVLPKNIENWDEIEPRVDPKIVCEFDLINDIEKQYNIDSSFGIYCIRLRDWCDWRNSDLSIARSVITKFCNELNIKMFIVGQNAEKMADELNVNHVSLREYASLLNSKYCKFCISPMSGIIQIANFCGHDNLYNFIFDHNGERGPSLTNHPLFMGDNVNYKNTKNIFLYGKETEEKIFELYNQYINE